MGSKANKGATSFLSNGYHTVWGDVLDLNEWQYHFVNTYVELAANRFSYNNLPESIDPRYMELSIMSTGSVCFFYDDILGYMALPGAWSGFDNQYNPIDYHIVTPTGFSGDFNYKDSVIIWNNFTRTSDMPSIYMYADLIAELYVTAKINLKGQKHPIVVLADSESQRLSLENAYAKLDGNHPVIYVKNDNRIDKNFTTIDAKVPFIAKDLIEVSRYFIEEFMKWMGVKVNNTQKKERTILQEQRDYNAVTYQLRNRGLHSRQLAVEKINRLFGLDIEVEFNEEGLQDYADELLDMNSMMLGGGTIE